MKTTMTHSFCIAVPTGVVTFTRRSIPSDDFPDWAECTETFDTTPIHVSDQGTIEDDGEGLLQVDFANKFLGGGVLNYGCVQEEIRFVICPELLISRLFTECLEHNECVVILGCERFNAYRGYASTFTWTGDIVDETPYDSSRRRKCAIVAIDAIPFSKKMIQYREEYLKRELNKVNRLFCVHNRWRNNSIAIYWYFDFIRISYRHTLDSSMTYKHQLRALQLETGAVEHLEATHCWNHCFNWWLVVSQSDRWFITRSAIPISVMIFSPCTNTYRSKKLLLVSNWICHWIAFCIHTQNIELLNSFFGFQVSCGSVWHAMQNMVITSICISSSFRTTWSSGNYTFRHFVIGQTDKTSDSHGQFLSVLGTIKKSDVFGAYQCLFVPCF